MGFIKKIPENCSGCLSCELTCAFQHFGYFDFQKSRIRIIHDEEHSKITIHQCIQCDEKSCVNNCPVKALSVDPKLGCIRLDHDLCIGCQTCLKKCNYNGVMWDAENAQPLICDLCDGDPECIKTCKLHQALVISGKEAVK